MGKRQRGQRGQGGPREGGEEEVHELEARVRMVLVEKKDLVGFMQDGSRDPIRLWLV
jgi:hypothetical protein